MKYLQIQQWIRALKADIAWSQKSITPLEPLHKKAQEQGQITPDGHHVVDGTLDLAVPTLWDLTPMVPPTQNHPVALADNHWEDSESENEVLNKPPIKKAVLETYHSRNQ